MKCKQCGQELGEDVKKCPICKYEQSSMQRYIGLSGNDRIQEVEYDYESRSRVVAGVLQIFFGGFGIGRFYLGYNRMALGQLFTFPIFFIGGVWGFIDGILILCGQVECDVNGVPLK